MNKRVLIVFVIALLAFWGGYEARDKKLFPIGRFINRTFYEPPTTPTQAEVRVYSNIKQKTEVACPNPEDALVIVGFGQSNGANYAGYRSVSDGRVLNYFNGKCYVASDPMLGATGIAGSVWIPLANKIASDKTVVLITFGVGSSRAKDWLDTYKLLPFYADNVKMIKATYPNPDYAVWIQGEADRGHYADEYEPSLLQVMTKVTTDFPETKLIMVPTSYCRGDDPAIVEAQKQVAQKIEAVLVDGADQLNSAEDRYDGCHFSEQGVRKFSTMLADGLKQH